MASSTSFQFLGLLEVRDLVVVGGVEGGAEGALAAVDEDAAGTGRGGLVDHVVDVDALGFARLDHLVAERILADAAHVRGGLGGAEHPLRDADGVLGGAARDVLDLEVLDHVVVHRGVLLLGEDRVVELEVVLVEELRGHHGGDVQEGVAHAEKNSLFVGGIVGSWRWVSAVRGVVVGRHSCASDARGSRGGAITRAATSEKTICCPLFSRQGDDRGCAGRRARGGAHVGPVRRVWVRGMDMTGRTILSVSFVWVWKVRRVRRKWR